MPLLKTCMCLMICCFLQPAYAATYLIDFGVPNGETTSEDGNGNLWNNLSRNNDPNDGTTDLTLRTGSLNLISTTGETGFVMSYRYPLSGNNFSGMNGFSQESGNLPNLGLLNVASAKNDGIWSQGPVTLEFTGLDPTLTYSFSLFAHRFNTPARSTNYQLIGESTSQTITLVVANTVEDGGQLVVFEDFRPDATGKIQLLMTAGSGGYTYLNAMQITVTPEPARWLLMVGGAMGMLMARRRQVRVR